VRGLTARAEASTIRLVGSKGAADGRRVEARSAGRNCGRGAGRGGSALGSLLLNGSDGYTGCLSQSGDLLKFKAGAEPLKPCTGNQVQVHFAGNLESVLAGTGLVGETENGIVTLSIDPTYSLPQGCARGKFAQWDGSAWVCGHPDDPLPPGPLP
jgi:hypothetical protein